MLTAIRHGHSRRWPHVIAIRCSKTSVRTLPMLQSQYRVIYVARFTDLHCGGARFNSDRRGADMIKTKKLKLDREVLAMLATKELAAVNGGIDSAAPANCEPSGIIPCPTKFPRCG
jgi:hypothetical protein